jgi:hypothetical protein
MSPKGWTRNCVSDRVYPSRTGRLLPVSKQKAERIDATDHHHELLTAAPLFSGGLWTVCRRPIEKFEELVVASL